MLAFFVGRSDIYVYIYFLLWARQEEVAKRIVDAAIAADKLDGLGYMEASSFDAGVRGRWRKAGPPHRQRMLRLSTSAGTEEPGERDIIYYSTVRVKMLHGELVCTVYVVFYVILCYAMCCAVGCVGCVAWPEQQKYR